MQLTSTVAVALLAQNAAAQFNMLRFACSQLVVDRVDPIVNPGLRYTPHLHQIVGGNSFNVTMDPTSHDLPGQSTCTSCNFKEDLSNYWTAVMFFKAKNGTYRRVPQVGNGGPQGQLVNKGGLDVYYIPSGKVTAFKPGFRMIAGNAANTDPNKVNKGNICHRCWTSTNDNNFVGGAPCSGSDTVDIPYNTQCKMIRQTIIFPTCWDGKNLDSPDHQSHVAYSGTGASGGGSCPSTHPVKLPQIMYELMWNVSSFMDQSIFPSDGSNPFVYSMNLGGTAAHGDYVFGWKDDSLQKAMDNGCNGNAACPKAGLTALSPDVYSACNVKQQAPEDVDGWLKALPMGTMAIKA
ncbi:Nucleoside diphosphate-linked moiety X motif 17 [Pleurostoma richardsiae]|uniref:Nucleoside diphosphate-linked moiety X motif 17 n=1 Tax=Pleurostoma richardsiae TaxID=41990 RepID=A0AA38R1G4_9PEZI|nr:Nucleoside diphosphate-linked moiety X motif 17 [Pleurostoma richardsiae]